MAYGSASVDTFNTSTGQVFSPASSSATMKNRIINGDHRIDQRNAGASVTPASGASTYITDRFSVLQTQASKFSAQQNAGSVTPPPGFSNYLGFTSLSAATIGAGDLFRAFYPMEGYAISDLAWGTANAKPITISFWARSSLTGNFGACLQNQSNNRAYAFIYNIPIANTWTYCTTTIPGETTGTWYTNNTLGLGLFTPSSTRFKIACASLFEMGAGRSETPPIKPSTFGVLRTRCQVSLVNSISTKT